MSRPTSSSDPRHPIRVVSERTGLSPDVLRAWERRHRVVAPGRSEAGQRLYSDADIDRLALLAKATQAGRSLGSSAALPLPELRQLVAEDAQQGASRPLPGLAHADRAFAESAALAPDRLQVVLRSALLSLGASAYLEDVVSPLLRRIGEAWHAGELSIAHEHAATAVVRSTLTWLMDSLDVPAGAPCVVIGCLAREQHELGAMLASASAALAGWRVVYLGADLPAAEFAAAARQHAAKLVGISAVLSRSAAGTRAELRALRRELPPGVALVAGGNGVTMLGDLGQGIAPVRDLAQWRAMLHRHAPVH